MANPLVIYHANCADGFTAAWCFYDAYGDEYDYFPGVYQAEMKDIPDVTDRDVFFVDFSYKCDVMENLLTKAKTITVIDHHKSAIDDLKSISDTKFTMYATTKHSGAMLAWKYLYDDEQPPLLLLHVEDRDLWKFKLDKTREIQAALFSYPYDFAIWSDLMSLDQSGIDQLAKEGETLERKHFKDIHELLKVLKRDMIIGGITVPVASLPYTMVSDAANIMAENAPFAACYWDTDSRRIFGLRASTNNPNKMDVSKIAEIYGGGGHVDAAGFSVDRDHYLAKC